MIAPAKIESEVQPSADVYLGFTIVRRGEHSYVAVPGEWNRTAPVALEGASLPVIRQRIWSWWHRLLD